MSNKKIISRRSLVGTATALVAAEAGLKVLNSPLMNNNEGAQRIKKAISNGDGKALANSLNPTNRPVFNMTIVDKADEQGIFTVIIKHQWESSITL